MSIKSLEKNPQVKFSFALSHTFNAFIKKWPAKYNRAIMVETWANALTDEKITIEHIRLATNYCVAHLNKWPSIYKFKTYCERAAHDEALDTPVITDAEKMAADILNTLFSSMQNYESDLRNYTEGLLIAALVTHRLHYEKTLFPYEKLAVEEVSLKFAMLLKELPEWLNTAKEDKEFWLATFLEKLPHLTPKV